MLGMLLRKHSYHRLRQHELRCFRIWASKWLNTTVYVSTLLDSYFLSASAVRITRKAVALVVKLMKYKATRLNSVIKLMAILMAPAAAEGSHPLEPNCAFRV